MWYTKAAYTKIKNVTEIVLNTWLKFVKIPIGKIVINGVGVKKLIRPQIIK